MTDPNPFAHDPDLDCILTISPRSARFILRVLNEVEGMGYGGMADFECAREEIRDALQEEKRR